jgi:hypothetical protein
MSRLVKIAIVLVFAACGGSRQGAATQAAVPFDAKGSDDKATAVADLVLAAVGGADNWTKAKEVVWTQGIVVDGDLKDFVQHAWDRWNGRHQFTRFDANGSMGKTGHDLYGEYRFGVIVDAAGHGMEAMKADADKMAEEARKRFYADSYLLFLPFKLKDSGVHLKFVEERPEEGSPKGSPMKYDVIKVSFDNGIGPSSGDVYYVVVEKESHLPTTIERVLAGKSDDNRQGFKLSEWKESGGLKFATRRTTLGYTKEDGPKTMLKIRQEWKEVVAMPPTQLPEKSEIVIIPKITVSAEPDDILYVKPVSPDRI